MSNKYNFPSTRFLGSKVKLLNWIWDNVKNLEFETAALLRDKLIKIESPEP